MRPSLPPSSYSTFTTAAGSRFAPMRTTARSSVISASSSAPAVRLKNATLCLALDPAGLSPMTKRCSRRGFASSFTLRTTSAITPSIESARKVCAERTRNGRPRKSESDDSGSAATFCAIAVARSAESIGDIASIESSETAATRPEVKPTRQPLRAGLTRPAGQDRHSAAPAVRVTGETTADPTFPARPTRSTLRFVSSALDC